MIRLAANREQAMLWGRFPFFAVALGVAFFLYFCFVFPERIMPKWIPHPLVLIIPGVAFASLSFTNLILEDVRLERWGYESVHGPLHAPFIIFYILPYSMIGIALLLIKFFKTSSPIRRLQLKYILIGITVAPITAIITNGILPIVWSGRFSDVGPTSFIIFVSATSYAIVKHRLMDIDFVIKKGSILFFTMIVLCFPLFYLLTMLIDLFYGIIHYEFTILVMLLFVLFFLVFLKIRTITEERVEKLLFRNRYRNHQTIVNFGRALISILDLNSLSRRVIDTACKAMEARNGSLYILNEEKSNFELYEHRNLNNEEEIIKRIPQNDYLFEWVLEERTVPVKEELTLMPSKRGRDHVLNQMNEMQSELCIPLISRKRVIGLINLGRKQSRIPYTIQDIELLTTLANQTAIAIENAKLYEDLKKQKAVMRRADRLASLGTLTAGLAHEIRNPLVAIKTLTQLLPERIDDEEFRRDFLAIASGEVDRISSLVNELLEFARPTEPQLQFEDIQQIMDGMILLISTEARKKNLDIESRYEDNLPPIPIDREQIKQVFLNILLNAIEATDEGGQITVEIRTFSRKEGEEFLQVEIRDTGRGIPEEHLDDIFTPFFTTKDAGSGLGLSISHQIIQEHRGTINVQSRMGEGSSFVINFSVSAVESERKAPAKKSNQASQPFR